MSKFFRLFIIVIIGGLFTFSLTPRPTYAAGTVTTCSLASFTTALSGGGVVDFATGGVCRITIGSRITIGTNTTIQNTSGFTVTFTTSPRGGSPLFDVDPNMTVNIDNIIFEGGGGVSGGGGTFGGGAFFNNGGALNITNSTFNGNFGGRGGAILNVNGTVNISGTVFNANSAISDGASIANDGGIVTVNSSLFTANRAGSGSGIHNASNGTVTINNSTFSGNTPGTAVYNLAGTVTIRHSTFSGNSSFLNPANIYYGTGTTTVTASIFNGGTSDNDGGCNGTGTLVDGGNNITFNTTGCLGANINPNLGALSGGVHIPANRNIEYAPACVLSTDQLGASRPQGALCTPGAVEADPLPQSTMVQFTSASGNTMESSNTGAFIRVTTSDTFPTNTAITATINVTGGTADGADYSLSGTINIPANTAHNTTFSVDSVLSIINDFIDEDAETLDLSLSLGGGNLGAQNTYTHTINDDDTASIGMSSALTISEPNGSSNFSIQLFSQPTAGVTLDFTASDPTECALPTTSFTLSDMNPVSVTVNAVDDALVDGNQPCDITLVTITSSDAKYSALPTGAQVNVTVQDDDIPNAILLISGDSQQTAINTAFTNPLTVQVNDAGGQPLEGATVNFTVPATGASAMLSAYSGITDVNGQVTVTATANGEVGVYQVSVESGALTPVNLNLENLDPDVLDVTAICVGDDLTITINAGAPNFDITGTSGADLPQLNQPLGTYTFTGPDIWVGVTITELTGDLEFITLPDITCEVAVVVPPVVQAPPPPVPDRCDIRGYSLEMPVGIFCTDLYINGQFTIAGSVPANLASSVIDAVDVGKFNGERTVAGEFERGLPICLEGQGRLFFLDASTSPRAQFELTTFVVDGRTCGFIINGGTVVLIR